MNVNNQIKLLKNLVKKLNRKLDRKHKILKILMNEYKEI